jgi:hypothetical protein
VKHGAVEKHPSENNFEALVSLSYQEKLSTSLEGNVQIAMCLRNTTADEIFNFRESRA